MGITRQALIEEAKRLVESPLSNLGYSLEENPRQDDVVFWFIKRPDVEKGAFHIIEFFPSGISDDDLFEMEVNLFKRNFHDHIDIPPGFPARAYLDVPFTPCMWRKGGEKFYRWHFVSLADVQEMYMDILDKLLKYGVPFLEAPTSTYDKWLSLGAE